MINKEKMNNYIKLNIIPTDLLRELAFKAIRSQGKGGQNVNKVATKIVLIFDLDNSSALNEDLKKLIKSKLGRRVDSKGILQLSVSKERSQYLNKTLAIKKFINLIDKALEQEEERIETKPTRKSKERRLLDKAVRSRVKAERQKKHTIDD
jgi:ribosome-associated protein